MTVHDVLVATDLTLGSELALERTLSFCSGANIALLHVLRAALPDPLRRIQLHSVIEGILPIGRCILQGPQAIGFARALPRAIPSPQSSPRQFRNAPN